MKPYELRGKYKVLEGEKGTEPSRKKPWGGTQFFYNAKVKEKAEAQHRFVV